MSRGRHIPIIGFPIFQPLGYLPRSFKVVQGLALTLFLRPRIVSPAFLSFVGFLRDHFG